MTNSISFFVKTAEFVHRFGDIRLQVYTQDPSLLLNTIEPIFYKVLKYEELIRSIGVTLQNLRRSEDVPRDLFGTQEKSEIKDIIERAGDIIRKKFGHNALKRVSSIKGVGKKVEFVSRNTH